jgi:hypothetical protein
MLKRRFIILWGAVLVVIGGVIAMGDRSIGGFLAGGGLMIVGAIVITLGVRD